MQVKGKKVKFTDWIKKIPINKRKFIVPDNIKSIFNLPEEIYLKIILPSFTDILPGRLILTREMCDILGYPGLEGTSVDTIAHPLWTPFKNKPINEIYRNAFEICNTLDLTRCDKEPEKSAIELTKLIHKDVYNRLISQLIVPVFTDAHFIQLDTTFYLVQNYKHPLAIFKERNKAEEYILMLRQLMYEHGVNHDALKEILQNNIPKYTVVEVPGVC